MPTIRQDDVIRSVADALQYISFYHPADYIANLARAYEHEQSPAAAGVLGRGIFRLGAAGRHGEAKPRALVRLTLHPDAPAMFLHQALADGQSETGPFLNAFGGGSRLVECIENSFQIGR